MPGNRRRDATSGQWEHHGSAADRFWSKVNKDGPTHPHLSTPCWPWTAGLFDSGYGQFWYEGENWRAHRFAWCLAFGEPLPGMCVLHRCDRPNCVRPDHLFLGTDGTNSHDMLDKDRDWKHAGEDCPRAVLTWETVHAMRAKYRRNVRGFGYKALAVEFGTTWRNVEFIIKNKTWKDPAYVAP